MISKNSIIYSLIFLNDLIYKIFKCNKDKETTQWIVCLIYFDKIKIQVLIVSNNVITESQTF